jgi:MSHA biogenesis protein MshI
VDKPNVPESEICAALKWQIKDLVTFTPDDMVLDYFDGPVLSGGGEKINVVCAVASELRNIVSATNKGNMILQSITTQEFAFSQLVAIQNDACLLVCQEPGEEIVILIVKQGQLYFHRRLRGFLHIAEKSDEELASNIIDNLSLEIQRSTDYFERQLKQAPIKELKVLIPIKSEAFFARKLAENTNVPVTLLALPEPYHEQREYAVALSAAIGNSVRDLAPVDDKKVVQLSPDNIEVVNNGG